MFLEDLSLYLLQPGLEKSGLREPGEVVGGVRALEILIGRILSVRIARAEYRRGSGAELVAGRQHPRMPRAGKWSHRGRTAPNARRRGKRAREGLIGPICIGICDHGLCYLMAEVHASDHITRKRDAGDDPRPALLIRHAIDRRGLVREKI